MNKSKIEGNFHSYANLMWKGMPLASAMGRSMSNLLCPNSTRHTRLIICLQLMENSSSCDRNLKFIWLSSRLSSSIRKLQPLLKLLEEINISSLLRNVVLIDRQSFSVMPFWHLINHIIGLKFHISSPSSPLQFQFSITEKIPLHPRLPEM